MQTRSKTFQITQFHIFWSLVALIATSIFLYGYLVNVTIWHTAERQEIEDSIVEIKTSISQLELKVIDSSRNLTKEYAYNMGFALVDDLTFVERNNVTRLSLNEL